MKMDEPISEEPLTVFISARVQEMTAERLAAGATIAAMRLRPVLFEHTSASTTARPVYLEAARSCDIFTGLYGDQYGDAAAGQCSPIEQEFLETLAVPLMPRLLFVRRTRRRQHRLRTFLEWASARATVVSFTTHNDLARQLKERLGALLAAGLYDARTLAAYGTPVEYDGVEARGHAPLESPA